MTYLVFLMLTMITSVIFSIQPATRNYTTSYMYIISPILLFTLLGVIKQRKTRIKYLILVTSVYYLITAYSTLHGMIKSFYILIPLTLIPLLTEKYLDHTGLGNRMGMAFWLVVVLFMHATANEAFKPFALTLCVLLSYFLITYTLHTSTIKPLEIYSPIINTRKTPITEYNPEQFEHPKH